MAIQVSTIYAQVAAHFNGLPHDTFLTLFQQTNFMIQDTCRIVPDTTIDLTLVAGTQDYSVADSVQRIWSAYYYTSATSFVPLVATSIDKMDDLQNGWRAQPAGQPVKYWERGGYVGLWPKPDTSTSGGYPKVTMYVFQNTGDLTMIDTVPGPALYSQAWEYEICRRYALMQKDARYQVFTQEAKKALNALADYQDGRIAADNASLLPRIPRIAVN